MSVGLSTKFINRLLVLKKTPLKQDNSIENKLNADLNVSIPVNNNLIEEVNKLINENNKGDSGDATHRMNIVNYYREQINDDIKILLGYKDNSFFRSWDKSYIELISRANFILANEVPKSKEVFFNISPKLELVNGLNGSGIRNLVRKITTEINQGVDAEAVMKSFSNKYVSSSLLSSLLNDNEYMRDSVNGALITWNTENSDVKFQKLKLIQELYKVCNVNGTQNSLLDNYSTHTSTMLSLAITEFKFLKSVLENKKTQGITGTSTNLTIIGDEKQQLEDNVTSTKVPPPPSKQLLINTRIIVLNTLIKYYRNLYKGLQSTIDINESITNEIERLPEFNDYLLNGGSMVALCSFGFGASSGALTYNAGMSIGAGVGVASAILWTAVICRGALATNWELSKSSLNTDFNHQLHVLGCSLGSTINLAGVYGCDIDSSTLELCNKNFDRIRGSVAHAFQGKFNRFNLWHGRNPLIKDTEVSYKKLNSPHVVTATTVRFKNEFKKAFSHKTQTNNIVSNISNFLINKHSDDTTDQQLISTIFKNVLDVNTLEAFDLNILMTTLTLKVEYEGQTIRGNIWQLVHRIALTRLRTYGVAQRPNGIENIILINRLSKLQPNIINELANLNDGIALYKKIDYIINNTPWQNRIHAEEYLSQILFAILKNNKIDKQVKRLILDNVSKQFHLRQYGPFAAIFIKRNVQQAHFPVMVGLTAAGAWTPQIAPTNPFRENAVTITSVSGAGSEVMTDVTSNYLGITNTTTAQSIKQLIADYQAILSDPNECLKGDSLVYALQTGDLKSIKANITSVINLSSNPNKAGNNIITNINNILASNDKITKELLFIVLSTTHEIESNGKDRTWDCYSKAKYETTYDVIYNYNNEGRNVCLMSEVEDSRRDEPKKIDYYVLDDSEHNNLFDNKAIQDGATFKSKLNTFMFQNIDLSSDSYFSKYIEKNTQEHQLKDEYTSLTDILVKLPKCNNKHEAHKRITQLSLFIEQIQAEDTKKIYRQQLLEYYMSALRDTTHALRPLFANDNYAMHAMVLKFITVALCWGGSMALCAFFPPLIAIGVVAAGFILGGVGMEFVQQMHYKKSIGASNSHIKRIKNELSETTNSVIKSDMQKPHLSEILNNLNNLNDLNNLNNSIYKLATLEILNGYFMKKMEGNATSIHGSKHTITQLTDDLIWILKITKNIYILKNREELFNSWKKIIISGYGLASVMKTAQESPKWWAAIAKGVTFGALNALFFIPFAYLPVLNPIFASDGVIFGATTLGIGTASFGLAYWIDINCRFGIDSSRMKLLNAHLNKKLSELKEESRVNASKLIDNTGSVMEASL